jgi:hypothetical protein
MDMKKEQIEQKLIELQAKVESDPARSVSVNKPSADLTADPSVDVKSDLCYFGGLVSIALGLLMLFQHVRVGTGFFSMLGIGGQGFGLLMIPLLVGVGWILYDVRSRVGWAITSITCLVICFSVLSGLIMSFPSTSLLGLILMLLPFAVGGMLLFKGLGGPQGVKEKLKKEGLIK